MFSCDLKRTHWHVISHGEKIYSSCHQQVFYFTPCQQHEGIVMHSNSQEELVPQAGSRRSRAAACSSHVPLVTLLTSPWHPGTLTGAKRPWANFTVSISVICSFWGLFVNFFFFFDGVKLCFFGVRFSLAVFWNLAWPRQIQVLMM